MVDLVSCSGAELYTSAKTSVYSGSLIFIVFLIKTSTATEQEDQKRSWCKLSNGYFHCQESSRP